jgi:hypothetical protein
MAAPPTEFADGHVEAMMHVGCGGLVVYDPVAELTAVLRDAGVRPTLDRERNVTHPCTICLTLAHPRQLIEIGRYTRKMGGNINPGDAIERPMCASCVKATSR